MVFKCCVVNCRSNYIGEEKNNRFLFPKEEDLRKIWMKFVNRKDWEPTNSSYIYIPQWWKPPPQAELHLETCQTSTKELLRESSQRT